MKVVIIAIAVLSSLTGAHVYALPQPVSEMGKLFSPSGDENGDRTTPGSTFPSLKSQLPDGQCLPIQSVNFHGARILSDELKSQAGVAVQSYLGQCLNIAEIAEITQTVNRLFLQNGLVTTRADIPEQALTDGIMDIHISESSMRWEKPDNGFLTVNPPRPKWMGNRLSIGGDTAEEGRGYRGHLALAADDLAGINGALNLNYRRSLTESIDGRTWGAGFDYSFPWRYQSTISLNGSVYEYENSVVGSERKFGVSGDSQNINMSARRTLYSSELARINTLMGVTTRESSHVSEDNPDHDSSRQLSAFRMEAQLNYDLGARTTTFTSFSLERGLGIFGADNEDTYHDGNPRFRKYRVLGSIRRSFLNWNWDLNGQYQFSPDELPSGHRVVVASSSMIKGFDNQSLSGNEGGWLRLDARSPWGTHILSPSLRSSLRLSVLKGWVPHTEIQSDHYGTTSAAEVGLQVKADGLSAGFRVGRMLEKTSETAHQPDMPDFSMNLSFTL